MSNDEKKHLEIWKPIGQGWLYVCEVRNSSWMDFKAYEVVSRALDGSDPSFRRLGATGGDDETDDYRKAEPALSGYIKWDGCMEVTRGSQHVCGFRDLQEHHAAEAAVYQIASEHLAGWDPACADYPPPKVAQETDEALRARLAPLPVSQGPFVPPPQPVSPVNDCDHGVTFDEAEARGMTVAAIRHRWPRLHGVCPKGCGFSGIAYASYMHYGMGDW